MQHNADSKQMINLTIDGIPVTVPAGTLIINAARKAGIKIPYLCYHPDLKVRATCRICVVEIKGQRKLKAACSNEVWEGVEVITNSEAVRAARRTVLELILTEHKQDCPQCVRNMQCELQVLSRDLRVDEPLFFSGRADVAIEDTNPAIVRDPNKCVKCERCVEVCQNVLEVGAINTANRSTEFAIGTPFNRKLDDTTCVFCGKCIAVCPVGALYEKDDTGKVWAALDKPEIQAVVQVSPPARIALGEELGLAPGEMTTGKMVKVLRRLGFSKVFDASFAAGITMKEEWTELLERLQHGGRLPLITSRDPALVMLIEKAYPQLLPHLATCKSPQQVFGALLKSYYAKKNGLAAENLFAVSVMPSVAKKYEAARPEMTTGGQRDVDAVLTIKELARMIKVSGLDMTAQQEAEFDAPFGLSVDGHDSGDKKAAPRTMSEAVTDCGLAKLGFMPVPGLEGVTEAEIQLEGQAVKVAVGSEFQNLRALLEQIIKGDCKYQLIELMCGCAGGGENTQVENEKVVIRQPHKNPAVQALYEELFDKAPALFHTGNTAR